MKRLQHLLTFIAVLCAFAMPAMGQLRLTQVITDQDTCRYYYDVQGRISTIDLGIEKLGVAYQDNKVYITPTADSSFYQLILTNELKTRLTKGSESILTLNPDEEGYADYVPYRYDAKGRLTNFGMEEDTVLYQEGRIVSCGDYFSKLTYEATPQPAEVQAYVNAIPNFLLWTCLSDNVYYRHLLPVAYFGTGLHVAPRSAQVVAHLPHDELQMPDRDDYGDPFLDIIDARSPRLIEIEAVRPSMQLEQAISQTQEAEEQWMTLQQHADLWAEAKRIYAEREASVEAWHEGLTFTMPRPMQVHYTYTPTTTVQGQRALRLDVVGEATAPTDLLYKRSITFVFE